LVGEQIKTALKYADITLPDGVAAELDGQVTIGLEPSFRTPRQAKLYGNALLFALPLLKGEVNIVDQILLEGMRIFYPELYRLVRNNSQPVLGSPFVFPDVDKNNKQKEIEEFLDRGTQGATPRETRAARDLLFYLFPRLEEHGLGYGYDERWAREQRLCSDRYFEHYFSYVLDKGDVSDTELDRFLTRLDSGAGDAVELFSPFVAHGRAGRTLEKLMQRADEMSPAVSGKLALAVARSGEAFPMDDFDAWLPGSTAADMAALLARRLISHIEPDRRTGIRANLLQTAEPLVFAGNLFSALAGTSDDQGAVNVSEEEKHELESLLATRIAAGLTGRWFFTTGWGDADVIRIWHRALPKEVEAYLARNLLEDDRKVIDLLIAFAPKSTGRMPNYAFDHDSYKFLGRFVSMAVVVRQTTLVLGNSPSLLRPEERTFLEKFIQLHESMHNGGAAQTTKQVPGEEESPS